MLSPTELMSIVRVWMAFLGESGMDFCGRSLCCGCITVGFEALLPEYLVYLQTGHQGLGGPAAIPAGRGYAVLRDHAAIFALWYAFLL